MADRNCRIRFMHNNFAELTTGQVTYSSALAAFPGANAINKFRAKVWKPSGHFLITTSNQNLHIRQGGAGDTQVTAVVATGTYTTPGALATAIQTALGAVDAGAGWTVAHNSAEAGSFKFELDPTSSTRTLEPNVTTNAIWDTIGFVGSTQITQSTVFIADEQRNHTEEFATFDMGTASPLTFFGMIGPLDETLTFTNNATVKIRANNLDQWDSPPLDLTLTQTDNGYFRFLDDITDTAYRFWRFEFKDRTAPDGPESFKIGFIYIGDFITITQRNVERGFNKGFIDPSEVSVSEAGALFFDQKTKFHRIDNASMPFLNATDRLELEQFFHDVGISVPFFIALDPLEEVSEDLDELTKYVVFDSIPRLRHIRSNIYSFNFAVREVL